MEKLQNQMIPQVRVRNLIDSITFQVYQYTTRGLFECDKLIFTAQMAFQVTYNLIFWLTVNFYIVDRSF